MLQGLLNKTPDEKLNFAGFENRLLRKIEEATPSRRKVKKMTEAMLDNQDFIAPVATIVKEETKKRVDVKSERMIYTANLSRLPTVQAHCLRRQKFDPDGHLR